MRKKINLFISYAKANKDLVGDFIYRLKDVLAPSKAYEYNFWMDLNIIVGEDWDKEIKKSLDKCDLGILLISCSFLNSRYINEVELPKFVNNISKPCVPVLVQKIDFELHDLKGLEKKQIFRLDSKGFIEPRSYGECKGQRRNDFVLDLFRAIECKLRSPQ